VEGLLERALLLPERHQLLFQLRKAHPWVDRLEHFTPRTKNFGGVLGRVRIQTRGTTQIIGANTPGSLGLRLESDLGAPSAALLTASGALSVDRSGGPTCLRRRRSGFDSSRCCAARRSGSRRPPRPPAARGRDQKPEAPSAGPEPGRAR